MQHGIREADAPSSDSDPEIFHKDRYWVTHREVKYAIDLGKPIILVDGGFAGTTTYQLVFCVSVSKMFELTFSRMLVHCWER